MRVLLLAGTGAAQPAQALGSALAQLGHAVRLVLPAARGAGAPTAPAVRRLTVLVPHIAGDRRARVAEHSQAGVSVYRVGEPAVSDPVFLSLAALALCRILDWAPEAIHAFGSVGGPALYWLATDGRHEPLLASTAGVVSVTDAAAEWGEPQARALLAHGLVPSDAPELPDAARDSLLGLAVAHAEAIVVPGPTWARTLGEPRQGGVLGPVFASRRDRVFGIVPGYNLAEHDPAHDPALAALFTARSVGRRAANKATLQAQLGLAPELRTLLVGVAPGDDSSGAVAAALAGLAPSLAVQWAVLVEQASAAQACLAALARIGARAGRVPARQAGLFYAGSDVVLLPPKAAGDGGAAALALKYGALPLGLRQGALADLLADPGPGHAGLGFAFEGYNSAAIGSALARAQRAYTQSARWQARQRRAMAAAQALGTGSWARAMLAVYRQAINHRQEALVRLAQPSPGPAADGRRETKHAPARAKRPR